MYGMYDGLQGNSTYTQYYAARMFYYGDVRGDDMQARTQGMRTSSCYEMRYTADDAPNMWNIQYNVIRRANRLIEAVDNKTITGKEIKMLFVLAKKRESTIIFRLIKDIDPNAFVSQSQVIGVYGEGFDKIKVK